LKVEDKVVLYTVPKSQKKQKREVKNGKKKKS
jgi:hypothetical protein